MFPENPIGHYMFVVELRFMRAAPANKAVIAPRYISEKRFGAEEEQLPFSIADGAIGGFDKQTVSRSTCSPLLQTRHTR